jgi:hypothetical protein
MGIIAKAAQQAGVNIMNKENPNHGPDGKFTSSGSQGFKVGDKVQLKPFGYRLTILK